METESPEQLDNLLDLRPMPVWIAKIAISVLAVMILAYAFLGSNKDLTPGQGIFSRDLNNVPTLTEGTLQDLYVTEGDFVREGQVVARIAQGKGDMEMESLRSKVQLQLESHNLRAAKERQVRERVMTGIFKRISNLEVMQTIAARNYANSVELEAKKIITRLELQDLRGKEADIRKDMADAEAERAKNMSVFLVRRPLSGPAESGETRFEELPMISRDLVRTSRTLRKQITDSPWLGESPEEVDRLSRQERELRTREEDFTRQIRGSLAKDFEDFARTEPSAQTKTLQAQREKVRGELLKIDAVKYTDKALERVVQLLDLESQLTTQELQQLRYGLVRSRYSGRVVEVRYEVWEILKAGSNVVGLEDQGGNLRVSAFLNAKQAKNVRPGMAVQISPSTVKREEYGFLRGTIESVASYPASPERMEVILRNKMLVERINKDGSMLESVVRLDVKPNGRFYWAFGDGPGQDPTAGTVCQVSVQTGESAPVTKILPFLRRFLHKKPPELKVVPREAPTDNAELPKIPNPDDLLEPVIMVPGEGTARPGEDLPEKAGEGNPAQQKEQQPPLIQDPGTSSGTGRVGDGKFVPVEKKEGE
jgi:HlyD family secretion protein